MLVVILGFCRGHLQKSCSNYENPTSRDIGFLRVWGFSHPRSYFLRSSVHRVFLCVLGCHQVFPDAPNFTQVHPSLPKLSFQRWANLCSMVIPLAFKDGYICFPSNGVSICFKGKSACYPWRDRLLSMADPFVFKSMFRCFTRAGLFVF